MSSIYDEIKLEEKKIKDSLSLIKKKRYTEAISLLEAALKRLPDNKDGLYQMGIALSSLENYKDAIVYFRKLTSRYPKFKQGWFEKGNAFYAIRKYESAIICYNRALRIDKKYQEAINKKSIALSQIERENTQVKEILEYEYKNQRDSTKIDLINDLKFSINDASHLINIFISPITYTAKEIPKLKSIIETNLNKNLKVTLYDLVIRFGLNLKCARKVAKFLTEEIGVNAVPRFPRKIDSQKRCRDDNLLPVKKTDNKDDVDRENLPKITDSQKMGNKAAYHLAGILSECCNVNLQNSDLGIDLDCELYKKIGGKKSKPTGKRFYIQSKGKKEVEEEGEFIKVPIKIETINYWLQQIYPTFLIVVDDTSQICYWMFPQEVLGKGTDNWKTQKTLTFKLPKSNFLEFKLKELPIEMRIIIENYDKSQIKEKWSDPIQIQTDFYKLKEQLQGNKLINSDEIQSSPQNQGFDQARESIDFDIIYNQLNWIKTNNLPLETKKQHLSKILNQTQKIYNSDSIEPKDLDKIEKFIDLLLNFSQEQNEPIILELVSNILIHFIFKKGIFNLVKSKFYSFLKDSYEKGYQGTNISLVLTKFGYFDPILPSIIIESVNKKNKMLLETLRTNNMIPKLTWNERNKLCDDLLEKKNLLTDSREDKILFTELEHWIRLL